MEFERDYPIIKRINWHERKEIQCVYELQRAAYFIEAKLIGTMNLPPLKESIEQFRNCEETFFGYYKGQELAGAISVSLEEGALTICRLVVHPNHFRQGIAQRLLQFIEHNIENVWRINVATGKENTPAVALYIKNGFRAVEDVEVEPGLFIRLFIKNKVSE